MNRKQSSSRKSSSSILSILRAIVCTICGIGCATHLILVSVDYFKFQTLALYAPYIPLVQRMPFVTVCLTLNAKEIASLTQVHYDSEPINESAVIKNCYLRNFSSGGVEKIDCAHGYIATFAIRRQQFRCYSVRSRVDSTYMILDAAAVMNNRRVLYTFYLAEQFEQRSEIMPMMHFKQRPDEEFRFSTHTHLGEGPKNISIEIGYKLFESYRLPFPYDTNCAEASVCLNSVGRRYAWCKQDICSNNFTVTFSKKRNAPISGIFMEVRSLASPSTRVEYIPDKKPSTFILEVCSLCGLWLGLSVHLLSDSLVQRMSKKAPRSLAAVKLHSDWHRRVLNISKRAGIDIVLFSKILVDKLSPPTEESGLKLFRLLEPLVKLSIIVAFMRELSLISIDFFQYKTRMEIEMRPEDTTQYPSISHCIDMYEWFHHEEPICRYKDYDELMTRFTKGFNFTQKQVFDKTPKESSVIDKCLIRQSATSPLELSSDCNPYFHIQKFYFGVFMCYQFNPLVKYILPTEIERNSSILYSVIIQESLAKMAHYMTIVSYGIPRVSRLLVSEVYRQSDRERVDLDFIMFKYRRLPLPYDTRCSYSNTSYNCLSTCMNYSQIGRIPFSGIFTEQIDEPILNYVDLRNDSVADFVESGESRCRGSCASPCYNSFTKTFRDLDTSDYWMQLVLLTPKYPVYFLKAIPIYTVYAYVYQLACSASFWIGFSLINIATLISNIMKRKTRSKSSVTPLPTYMDAVTDALEKIIIQRYRGDKGCNEVDLKKSQKMKSTKSEMKARVRRMLYFSFLVIGFSVHSFYTSSLYFKYPAVMDTRSLPESNYSDFRSTVCISLDQLELGGDFSLHNIWAKSPKPDELMVECGYRGLNLPEISHLPRNLQRRIMPYVNSTSTCNSLLRIKKFTTLGLLCYEVVPGEGTTDTEYQSQYQIGTTSNRVYHYLILSPRISSYNLTVAISQGSSENALIMPTTPHRTWPGAAGKFYYMTYVKFSITSLAYPYDMGVYDSLKQIVCMRHCLDREARKTGVFSPYGDADSPSVLVHETEIQSIQPQSVKMRQNCQRRCKYSKQHKIQKELYFEASAEGPYNTSHFPHRLGSIGLWFKETDQLVTTTIFSPKLRLVDLVLYIGSLFSIWFGFSAIQFIDWSTKKFRREPAVDDGAAIWQKLKNIDELINKSSTNFFKYSYGNTKSQFLSHNA